MSGFRSATGQHLLQFWRYVVVCYAAGTGTGISTGLVSLGCLLHDRRQALGYLHLLLKLLLMVSLPKLAICSVITKSANRQQYIFQ